MNGWVVWACIRVFYCEMFFTLFCYLNSALLDLFNSGVFVLFDLLTVGCLVYCLFACCFAVVVIALRLVCFA